VAFTKLVLRLLRSRNRPIAAGCRTSRNSSTRMLRFRNVVTRRLLTSAPQSSLALPVHNTIHRFFHILDGLEPEAKMHELFMEDATLHVHVPKANLLLDAGEIDDWVAKTQAGWNGQPTLHTEGNVVIHEPEPGLVVSHSTWSALLGGSLISYGTHADILKQVPLDDGESQWKFQRRVVRHLYSAS